MTQIGKYERIGGTILVLFWIATLTTMVIA